MEYKLKPITAENDFIYLHVLRESDVLRQDDLVNELLAIYGNPVLLEHSPHKYTMDKTQISQNLFGITVAYQMQLGYTHFITWKDSNEVIGVIEILTPKRTEGLYPKKDTWFIEYYLNQEYWGNGMMTDVLKAVVHEMHVQGIERIGAVCLPENKASIRVLEKSGFKRKGHFDAKQDYYEY